MIKNISLFPNKNSTMRECGECTECCKGYLKCNVLGQNLGNGVGCNFLKKEGCGIYDNRPNQPCKEYNCVWKENLEIPDNMRPDKSNVIMNYQDHQGFFYLKVIETGKKLDSLVLSNIIQYSLSKNLNLEYSVNGNTFHLGSKEFLQMVENERKNNRLTPT